jgi:proline iminopeptidase
MNEQFTDEHLNQSGVMDVGLHKIYWEDWGNQAATPIFYLHGGPGIEFSQEYRTLFDPTKHRVIFHNQRGAGKSQPYACIEENTTQDLIADIEKLREQLGIENMYVVGGSWGSALTLFYVIAHPERVINYVIWSVFTGSQFEIDFVNEGYARYFFPEAWQRFIALVPESCRTTGDSIMSYYADKIRSEDLTEAHKYADEWTLWESTLCSIEYSKETLESEILGGDNLSTATLETHYFMNKNFVPENYVIDNLHKIKRIDCVAVQGRFDMCTPPVSICELSNVYGEYMKLYWVNCGHFISEQALGDKLRAVFLQKCT